jgi:hypothetical protein
MVFFSLRGWQTEPVFSLYTHGPCLKMLDTKKQRLLMAVSPRNPDMAPNKIWG